MAPSHLVLLLGASMLLLHSNTVYCQELLGLPPTNMLESLVRTYQDHLSLNYNQQRLFPSLKFNFSGRIIGWKFAAADNLGGGRAVLSVWSPNNLQYIISAFDLLEVCPSLEITLDDGRAVFIHESGPFPPGIVFNPGDILGMFMRPRDVADFVVYLYDGNQQSAVSAMNGYFSYNIEERGPLETEAMLSNINDRDQLLPLISLQLCTTDSSVNHIYPACNGRTMQTSPEECERMLSTFKTSTSNIDSLSTAETTLITPQNPTPSYNTSSTSDITLSTSDITPSSFQATLLIVAIALPGVLIFIILLVCVLLVMTCCMFANEKRHSMASITQEETQHVNTSTSVAYNCIRRSVEQVNIDPMLVQSATYNVANSCGILQKARDYEEHVHSNTDNRNGAVVVVSHVYDSASLLRPTHAALLDKKISLPRAPLYEEMGLSSPAEELPNHVHSSGI